MQKARSDIEQFYLSGEYLRKNPSLHVEDSGWKAEVIAPFVDRFALTHSGSPLKVLDVGGGAGVLLSMIADRLRRTAGRPVTKCAIEFSPEMLEVQKLNNPDLERAEQGSIEATSAHRCARALAERRNGAPGDQAHRQVRNYKDSPRRHSPLPAHERAPWRKPATTRN